MAGQADAPNDSRSLQLQGIVQNAVLHHGIPVAHGVHVVDHAHVHPVRPQQAEPLGEIGLRLVQAAGPLILPVLPDGAYVALENKFFPSPLHGAAQVVQQLRLRRVQIDAIDAGGVHEVHHLPDLPDGLA